MTALFRELGYRPACDPPLLDPTAQDLRDALSRWFTSPERTADDLVAFYYSGHGVVAEQHYLLTADSDTRRLAASAIPVATLPGLFWSMDPDGAFPPHLPRRLLLMLDACYSGGAPPTWPGRPRTSSAP